MLVSRKAFSPLDISVEFDMNENLPSDVIHSNFIVMSKAELTSLRPNIGTKLFAIIVAKIIQWALITLQDSSMRFTCPNFERRKVFKLTLIESTANNKN